MRNDALVVLSPNVAIRDSVFNLPRTTRGTFIVGRDQYRQQAEGARSQCKIVRCIDIVAEAEVSRQFTSSSISEVYIRHLPVHGHRVDDLPMP